MMRTLVAETAIPSVIRSGDVPFAKLPDSARLSSKCCPRGADNVTVEIGSRPVPWGMPAPIQNNSGRSQGLGSPSAAGWGGGRL